MNKKSHNVLPCKEQCWTQMKMKMKTLFSWSPEVAIQPPVAAGNPSTPITSSGRMWRWSRVSRKIKTNNKKKNNPNAHFSNSPYTSRFQNILFFPEIILHFDQPLAAVHMLPTWHRVLDIAHGQEKPPKNIIKVIQKESQNRMYKYPASNRYDHRNTSNMSLIL